MTPLTVTSSRRWSSRASPTPGGAGQDFSDKCAAWLWRCLLSLALLGLPWCAYAKPEAESSASVDEVVTTLYHLDTLTNMKRQADTQRIRSELHLTARSVSATHGKEKAKALHAELATLVDRALAAGEWVLDHGTERKAQIHARFLALSAQDRTAIMRCVIFGGRFELQEADFAQARRHPPASEQGAAERRALFQKHFATGEILTRSACWSPELNKLVSSLLAPRTAEQHSEEPLSPIDAKVLEAIDLLLKAMTLLKPFLD